MTAHKLRTGDTVYRVAEYVAPIEWKLETRTVKWVSVSGALRLDQAFSGMMTRVRFNADAIGAHFFATEAEAVLDFERRNERNERAAYLMLERVRGAREWIAAWRARQAKGGK